MMVSKIYVWLLLLVLFAVAFQRIGKANVQHGGDRRVIKMEQARVALDSLIESDSFLTDAFLQPVKTRIRAENKKESILQVPEDNERLLGYWLCNTKDSTFSYNVRSANRSELYTIRGYFFLGANGRWTANIIEASRTAIFNLFGKKEYDQIQSEMTVSEVIKILGTPPGTFFAGEASFGFPNGRNANWPFEGSGKKFRDDFPRFFTSKPGLSDQAWTERAWVSNEIAIWITFKNGKVHTKLFSRVLTPNEAPQVEWNRIHQLLKERQAEHKSK